SIYGKPPLAPETFTKQLTLHVFHNQIDAALLFRAQHLDDRWMIQPLTNLLLALKAFMKNEVRFILKVRDFQRHGVTVFEIFRAKYSGHAAARKHIEQVVFVKCLAGRQLSHGAHFIWLSKNVWMLIQKQSMGSDH